MTPETRAKLQEVANRTPRQTNGKFTKEKTAKPTKETSKAPEPPRSDPIAVDVYFEPAREKFWTKNAGGDWMPINKGMLDLVLRSNWYSPHDKTTNSLTAVERRVLEIVMHHSVKYAGEVAGWTPGLQTICGYRVLVSRGPAIPEPKRGRWDTLKRFIRELLGDDERYFYAWMLAAFQSLKAGPPFAPGQLLAVAGPTGCGKSLLQQLITEMLGGRFGKPYEYLMGQNDFNDTMIGAEHLILDDEVGKVDIRTRRAFGTKLKATIANQTAMAHPKGAKAFNIQPFWRISMSLNDEPENLLALPPIDEDIRDKVILLRAHQATFPYPTKETPTREAFWTRLTGEVPAFLFNLLRAEMPKELLDQRYGVRAYQNKELMLALSSLSPETKLWTLILQSKLLENYSKTWSGTASELELKLQKTPLAKQVADVLYYPTACGTYLARLAKSQPFLCEKELLPGNKTVFHLADAVTPNT